MARGTRLDTPGAVHHVTARGIERRRIFRDDADRRFYLEKLTRNFGKAEMRCFAWALMPNHVHLLVRTGPQPLSTVMQRLGTGYARYFNRRHRRVGHLFQGRYKSALMEEDEHLLAVLRYVHRNPLRAGIVDTLGALEEFPWTGHSVLMGRNCVSFQSVNTVLKRFAIEPVAARARLLEWMAVAEDSAKQSNRLLDTDRVTVISGEPIHRDARILGSEGFTDRVLRELDGSERAKRRVDHAWGIDGVISYVCAELGADPQRLVRGKRRRVETGARAAIAFLASRQLGISYVALAPRLGVTHSALSRLAERGSEIVRERHLTLT